MLIPDIKGLKFPDEAVTRFFFKSGLQNFQESVLELGCGSGNNLRLFYEYGWNVTGVDLNSIAVSDARENLSRVQFENQLNNEFNIFQDNMLHFLEAGSLNRIHTVLFPSSLFYLRYDEIIRTLDLVSKLIGPGGYVFFKLVTNMDYRFLNPNKENLGNSSWRLKFKETDEYDCVVTYLSKEQWIKLIKNHFNFEFFISLDLDFEHIQNGRSMENSNIVCYGKTICS